MIERAPGVIIAARYRLVRQLGVGGMGTVWLAHDLLLDSACALKLIDNDKAQNEEVRLRFSREAKVAAQLRGSHVVDVFEHGEWEGIPFIAMEVLEGEDLGSRIERLGRLDAASTYRVVAHVARALVRAHSLGIVHRDLKPENIFLVAGDDGEIAKVLDFGIAKHDAYSLRDKATKTGSFLGTPYYVSPEQARGKETDHRSDLWSLGVIAFQCLTGKPPFESEALGELMGLILYEDLPLPSERQPDLPPALDLWWQRAAARDREDRFQSARELADALGQALGLEQTITVAAQAQNRTSFADIDLPLPADYRQKLASGSGLREATPANAENRHETGAPLSRTRISAIPVLSRLRGAARVATSPREWRTLARGVPRRQLAAAGVLGGIALGALLTILFTARDPAPPAPAAVAEPAPLVPVSDTPEVIPAAPVGDVTTAGTTSTPPVPAASESASPDAANEKQETATPERTPGTAARNAAPAGAAKRKPNRKSQKRDYGI